jgi:tetratricopeptide (TPR) repeat protein
MLIVSCKPKKSVVDSNGDQQVDQTTKFNTYFIDGCTHFNNGNNETALRLLNKCLEIKPDEASVYFQISKVLSSNGDADKALTNALKANELAPKNVFYALFYSKLLKDGGQYSAAIKTLESSLKNHPEDQETVIMLDSYYMSGGIENSLDQRIKLWENYYSTVGYKLTTSLSLVALYKQKKDFLSAHQEYDKIKQASPKKYKYFVDDGNLYLENGADDKALINFNKALELNPDNFELNYTLFNYYKKKGDDLSSMKHLELAFKDPYTSLDKKLMTSSSIFQLIKNDSTYLSSSLAIADILIANYSKNPNALYTAARFYELNKNYQLAFTYFKESATINPNMFDSWESALRNAEYLKLDKEIITTAEQTLEFYPNVSEVYLKAAKSSNAIHEFAKAKEFAGNGLSFALDNETKGELLREQGIAQFELKEYASAQTLLLEAFAINDKDSVLLDYLGNVYAMLNENEKAVEYWKKANELGSNSQEILKKIESKRYVK